MKHREQYEKETGNKFPSGNQIAISEWYQEYVKWMEKKLEAYFTLSNPNFPFK